MTEQRSQFEESQRAQFDFQLSLMKYPETFSGNLLEVHEYCAKSLHLSSLHYDIYCQRSGRPYFTLDDGWALTFLDTGQPFFVDTKDRCISPWIIMGGTWETNVDKSLVAYADCGMKILDIGANIGYYTVKLGSKVGPGGKVLAFEPNPHARIYAEENIKLNAQTQITTLNSCALGNFNGTATLWFNRNRSGCGGLVEKEEGSIDISVVVSRLDDVVPDDWVIDLIKLDAEGFEKQILDGGREVIARSPDCALMLELRLEHWERVAPISELSHVCGQGKTIYAVLEDGGLQPLMIDEVRPFLLDCRQAIDCHMNYFLIAPSKRVQERIGSLVRK